jgi:hypothetical protein
MGNPVNKNTAISVCHSLMNCSIWSIDRASHAAGRTPAWQQDSKIYPRLGGKLTTSEVTDDNI